MPDGPLAQPCAAWTLRIASKAPFSELSWYRADRRQLHERRRKPQRKWLSLSSKKSTNRSYGRAHNAEILRLKPSPGRTVEIMIWYHVIRIFAIRILAEVRSNTCNEIRYIDCRGIKITKQPHFRVLVLRNGEIRSSQTQYILVVLTVCQNLTLGFPEAT